MKQLLVDLVDTMRGVAIGLIMLYVIMTILINITLNLLTLMLGEGGYTLSLLWFMG